MNAKLNSSDIDLLNIIKALTSTEAQASTSWTRWTSQVTLTEYDLIKRTTFFTIKESANISVNGVTFQ